MGSNPTLSALKLYKTNMKHQRFVACLLLALAFLVLVGMLLNIHIYWFVIDIVVILFCSGSGIYLLRKTQV